MTADPDFSQNSAAAVRRAGNQLIDALQKHIELAAGLTDPDDLTALDDSAELLREVIAEYAECQADHCGEVAPFEDLVEVEDDPSTGSGQGDEAEDADTALVTRLGRTDFMIVDESALLAEGGRAGTESGRAPEPVLDPEPMTVSRAIRLIIGARGADGLWRAPGIRPLWSETVFLRPDPVEIDDDAEADDDPLLIFEVDGEIVTVESDQYFR